MIDFNHRVVLDTIERSDLETIRRWRNTDYIQKWCRQNDPLSEPEQSAWLERVSLDPTIKMYSIRTNVDSDVYYIVGVCGLSSIDMQNRRAEFSIYIGLEYSGNGFGGDALKTLLTHGFKNLGLHLIWGESFEGNPAMTLFDRMGFKREGIRREFYFKGGKFINAHMISITAAEYLK